MNIAMICRILGLTLGVEAAFMIPPLAIALARREHSAAVGFAVTVAAILVFAALLRRMADRGELLLTGKRYALPPQKKPLETN